MKVVKDVGVLLCIGVNVGLFDCCLFEKYGKVILEVFVESVVWEVLLFEEYDFYDFKIFVKYNDFVVMVKVYC